MSPQKIEHPAGQQVITCQLMDASGNIKKAVSTFIGESTSDIMLDMLIDAAHRLHEQLFPPTV